MNIAERKRVIGGLLQSCRIFRQLVAVNLCILHRDVRRTGLNYTILCVNKLLQSFGVVRKCCFWTTSQLYDNCYMTTVRARCGGFGPAQPAEQSGCC